MAHPIKWSNIEHFREEEFTCKCGCGLNNINPQLVKMLDFARDLAKVPFTINSGCRCEAHNKKIGGSQTSSHLKGLAVDIKISSPRENFIIKSALYTIGFNRIGNGKDFIHVDIDMSKMKDVEWEY